MLGVMEKRATVTSKGQVTIPAEIRRALGLKGQGGPVTFMLEDGVVTVRSARKLTLTELLAGFDPTQHRHWPDERVWDDEAKGAETL